MQKVTKKSNARGERGSTVFLMAVSMVFMVAMAALAIDVVVLYVVRSEAQRAADAAALAGAHVFVSSGLTSGLVTDTTTLCNGDGSGSAQLAAINVAQQNNVGGQPGVILAGDIHCDFSHTVTMQGQAVPVNPLMTVKVTRQNIPTFFSRVWGNQLISAVSASATAEAFNMTGSGTTAQVQSSCLKPFLLPNLDPNHAGDKFVDTSNGGVIMHPGDQPTGIIGEEISFQPGDPTNPHAPNQFFPILFSSTPTLCPSCSSGDSFQNNIQCCNTDNFQCGTQYSVNTAPPTSQTQQDTFQGTQCMIHGPNQSGGADTINVTDPPFQFLAGSKNPTGVAAGTQIATSDSVVTVPLFDPPAAGPLPSNVQVIGFLQVFVESVIGNGTVTARVLNVVGCTAGNSAPKVVTGGGISPVPVRLVQPGSGGN